MSHDPNSSESASHEEFVATFARHQRRVFAYIGTLLPNLADAEEVMQETSLILWRKWSEFDCSRDFVRWANGIAHREVLRYLRQRNKGQLFFSETLLSDIADEYQRQRTKQDARQTALAGCIEKLNDLDRELVQRRYQEDVSAQQVADSLGRPVKSIYRSLDRIREKLMECIRHTLSSGGQR